MTYSEQIKALRLSQGLSQKQLGEKAGLSRVSIGLIERGSGASIPTLNQIAEALDCVLHIELQKKE